jgi:hypothetical protein
VRIVPTKGAAGSGAPPNRVMQSWPRLRQRQSCQRCVNRPGWSPRGAVGRAPSRAAGTVPRNHMGVGQVRAESSQPRQLYGCLGPSHCKEDIEAAFAGFTAPYETGG